MTKTKICTECGTPFSYDPEIYQSISAFKRKLTCSRTCQSKRGHRLHRERGEDKSQKKALCKTRTVKRMSATVRIKMDAQQAVIDRDVNARMNETFACRILKPGDPDFDSIAATITSLEKIRKTDKPIGITAPIDSTYICGLGRRESVDSL